MFLKTNTNGLNIRASSESELNNPTQKRCQNLCELEQRQILCGNFSQKHTKTCQSSEKEPMKKQLLKLEKERMDSITMFIYLKIAK